MNVHVSLFVRAYTLLYRVCVCVCVSTDEGGPNVIVQQLVVEPVDHASITLDLTGNSSPLLYSWTPSFSTFLHSIGLEIRLPNSFNDEGRSRIV